MQASCPDDLPEIVEELAGFALKRASALAQLAEHDRARLVGGHQEREAHIFSRAAVRQARCQLPNCRV